jgi:predicted metal-dependent peptidase
MSKLTHKQRIERCHIRMMSHKDTVWVGPVTMIGKVTIQELPMPTAGTDGRDTFYDPRFIDKLNDKQLRFVVAHETMHKALLHLVIHKDLVKRYETQFGLQQARQLVNMAQDFVINRDLMKLTKGDNPFMEAPDVPFCFDEKYADEMVWDTHKIAEDLAKNAKGGGSGGGKGKGSGEGQQSHDAHDWEAAEEMSAEEVQDVSKQIEQALRQGQILSKKMNGNTPREVGELLTPAVDWRQALRDFVTERTKGKDNATYAKPNRRYISAGIYMPSSFTESIDGIGFYCDTSGSIGPEDLREVLSEVAGCIDIIRPKWVDVMYWDTAVARHEHYEGDDVFNIMQTTKPAGGGGTSPSCVYGFYESRGLRKPNVAIWLSDGYVGNDWCEELAVPAFWVISSGGAVPTHIPHVQLPKR